MHNEDLIESCIFCTMQPLI